MAKVHEISVMASLIQHVSKDGAIKSAIVTVVCFSTPMDKSPRKSRVALSVPWRTLQFRHRDNACPDLQVTMTNEWKGSKSFWKSQE